MGKFLRLTSTGALRQYDEGGGSVSIYDQEVTIGGSGLATGSPLSLPASQTYTGDELDLYLNGQFIDSVLDYNYYGSGAPYTQVSFTFDLLDTDRIRFHIDRGP